MNSVSDKMMMLEPYTPPKKEVLTIKRFAKNGGIKRFGKGSNIKRFGK